MVERVWVVKLECETGSHNGEAQLLSAHTSEEGARAAVRDWQRTHGCVIAAGWNWDAEFWCPGCHWGADYEDVRLMGDRE